MIDASIPLQVQQPKIASPIQSIGQLMQLRGQIDAQALHRAQLQQAETQNRIAVNQETERMEQQGQLKDLQGLIATHNGDFDAAIGTASKSGRFSPTLLDKAQRDHADTVKAIAARGVEENTLHRASLSTIGDAVTGLLALPEDQQATEYAGLRARLVGDPTTSKDAAALPEQYNKPVLDTYKWKGPLAMSMLDAATKQQELVAKAAGEKRAVELFAQTLAEKKADVTLKQLELTGQKPIQPADQARITHEQATSTETARHNRVEEGIASTREVREGKAAALRAGGSLAALSDSQKALAQKVAEGDLSVEQLSRLPDKEAIIAGAIEMNPEWTRNTFATKKAFEDPQSKQSQNLGTISRIVGHIGRFEKNSEALGVSPSMLIGKSLTGTAAATANDAHAIAGELEKLVSGGVGTVGQVHAWQEELKSSRPGIRKAAIDEISQLIGSQYEGMQQTYKTGTGRDLPIEKYVSPEGRKWMAEKGIAGMKGKIRARDPQGKLQEADAGTPLPDGWKAE